LSSTWFLLLRDSLNVRSLPFQLWRCVEKQVNETFSNPAADSWNKGDKNNKFSISNVYHVQQMYIMYRLTNRMFIAFLLYLCQIEGLFKDTLNAYKIVAEEQTKDSLNFLSSLFEFL